MYKHNQAAKQKAYDASLQSAIAGNIHPVISYMMVTKKCNMACKYCIAQHKLNPDLGGLEEWKRAADIAYKLGNRHICFGGGEPLLAPFMLDLIDYVSCRDTIVRLNTNGTHLDKEKLHALDEAGLDALVISIDDLNGNPKQIFGKNLTPEIESVLQYIADTKFRFSTSIASIVTKINLPRLPEIVQRFSEFGLTTDFMLMVRGVGNWKRSEEIAFTENDLDEINRVFDEVTNNGHVAICHDRTKQIQLKWGVCTPAQLQQIRMEDVTGYNCKGGVNDLHVDNDGRISVCESGFASPTHIFDLDTIEDYHALIQRNREVTDQCKACPWTYRWIITHLGETFGFKNV